MDSHQSFPFNWGSHGPAYNQQVHGPLGGPPQLASSSSTFETPFQDPFQGGMTNELHSNNDIPMADGEDEEHPAPPAAIAQPKTAFSRRAKGEQLDWNAHKDVIRSLYIDQNKSLAETMQTMENLHFFKASKKLYKTMFKEWKWQKNLPTETALLMAEKAKRRKREEGKDTVFDFGGRLWSSDRIDSTLSRVKRSRASENLADAATPRDVSYQTPKALVDSPSTKDVGETSDLERIEISDDEPEDEFGDLTYSRPLNRSKLTLTWRGHSRAQLQYMWRTAIDCRNAGRSDEAEDMLHQVFIGMSHVLGKTNQDTIKVAYNLADLYADSGQMNEAIAMVEKVIDYHLTTYGCEDPRTQQNVLHAIELLNGWNRQADALGLLSLSKELLHSSSAPNAREAENRGDRKGKAVRRPMGNGSQSEISKAMHSVLKDLTPARVDYGLGVVRTHVAAKDRAAHGLLLAIISQCEDKSELAIQHIKAHAELLKLYDKFGEANEHKAEFEGALASLNKAWEAYSWKEDSIESFDFMEAALQLVANSLKCGYQLQARHMFRQASEKATAIFGSDDERTVWVLITIGLVYQTFMTWDDAEEWFEEAFAAALANDRWGPKDGITKEGLSKQFLVSPASRSDLEDCIWSRVPPAKVYAVVPEPSLFDQVTMQLSKLKYPRKIDYIKNLFSPNL